MIVRRPKEYIVNKDTELPIQVQLYYTTLKKKYGIYGARISELIQMLELLYGGEKFELFDTRTWNPGDFVSYLMDIQLKFMSGESIDLVTLHDDILKVYQWTLAEKKRFINEVLEEKIWAIFKYVIDPNLTFDNII